MVTGPAECCHGDRSRTGTWSRLKLVLLSATAQIYTHLH